MSTFIGFLVCRGPNYRNYYEESFDIEWKKNLRQAISDKNNTENYLASSEHNIPYVKYQEFVNSELYKIFPDPNEPIVKMLQKGHEIGWLLYNMDWVFLQAPNGSTFITTDNPIILNIPDDFPEKKFSEIRLTTKGIKKYIPLSKKICLVIENFGKEIGFHNVSAEIVQSINIGLIRASHELIIAHDKNFLEKLIEKSKSEHEIVI